MLNRNQLTHCVIWPCNHEPAFIELYDPDGIQCAYWQVTQPLKGSEVAKLVPETFGLMVENCNVLTLSGTEMFATKAEFDTAVQTERAVISADERLDRLEQRERRRERREARLAEENRQLRERIRAEQEAEQVLEETETTETETAEEQQQEVTTDET